MDESTIQSVKKTATKIIRPGLIKVPDGSQRVPLGSGVVTSILGEGGVAIVYEIWNEYLGITRAVKLLRPNYTAESRARFSTEMKFLAQLKHQNIIEIHAVGEWNGLPYIEMERIYGSSLYHILRSRGALPVEICVSIAVMVCRALNFTHNCEYKMNGKTYKGILHRDLKPANIMISDNGVVKLMDFGIATPTNVSMHTVEGTVVGSLNYISPEQISGKEIDTRTDHYSFGCVLYEMLTGKKAFPQKTMAELVPAKMKNIYRPLQSYQLKIPSKLRQIIITSMNLHKDKRYISTPKLLQDLEKIHKRMTPLSPEQVIELYFNKGQNEKKIVRTKGNTIQLALFGTLFIILAILGFATKFNFVKPLLDQTNLFSNNKSISQDITTTPSTPNDISFEINSTKDTIALASDNVKKNTGTQQSPNDILTTEPAKEAKLDKSVITVKKAPTQIEPTIASITSKFFNPIDSLAAIYGTNDLLTLISRVLKNGNAKLALELEDSLPQSLANSRTALIYKMRALLLLNDENSMRKFFMNNDIADLEFCLEKARYYYNSNKYQNGLDILNQCTSKQTELGDKEKLDRDLLYLKAYGLTKINELQSDEQTRKAAFDSWCDLKYTMKNDQSHSYYIAANKYIRQLRP